MRKNREIGLSKSRHHLAVPPSASLKPSASAYQTAHAYRHLWDVQISQERRIKECISRQKEHLRPRKSFHFKL